MSETRECPDAWNEVAFAYGVFLTLGSFLSFVPQHIKIIKKKSHVGLSFESSVVGVATCICNLANIIISNYYKSFTCCKQVGTFNCVGNFLSVFQIFFLWISLTIVVLLYIRHFDFKWLQAHNYDEKKIWKQTLIIFTALLVFNIVVIVTTVCLLVIRGDQDTATVSFSK